MHKNERIFLGITAAIMIAVCSFVGLKMLYPGGNVGNIDLPGREIPTEPGEGKEEIPEPQGKVYVNVFFIGQNENKEEIYKAVKREYDKDVDGTKISFAIETLVAGPKPSEKSKGVYSEIPPGTRVISISEQPDKIIINLNSTFEAGGGTDSVYKRLFQLIKTAKNNTTKPVYLYIEGQRADVIGGEGIMLTQPLNDRSLDG